MPQKKHGHCNVPARYAKNITLRRWVVNQRRQYKFKYKDKHSTLTSERQATLEKIGFKWGSDYDTLWQTRYDELVAFQQQNGHCNVPTKYTLNKPLGLWVSNQRRFYKLLRQGKRSCMTAERQAALEKTGFECGLDNEVLGKRDMMSLSHSSSNMVTAMYLENIIKTNHLDYGFRIKGSNISSNVRANHPV